MRVKSLTVNGFRGFSTPARFDLDADAVVFVGPNGSGKTSLFDAILWALCGRVDRVKGGDPSLVSLYAETGRAEVSVEIGNPSESLTVTRVYDGKVTAVTVETAGVVLRGPAAIARLGQALWPDSNDASAVQDSTSLALTRSTYLQQDLVDEFIGADSDDKRFQVISELFGAGRVAELQGQLERERTSWARTRSERERDLTAARSRVSITEQRLARLAELAEPTGVAELWRGWWDSVGQQITIDRPPRLGAPAADEALDNAMQRLRGEARRSERSLREIDALLERSTAQPVDIKRVESLRDQLRQVEEGLAAAEQDLTQAQASASRERERQVKEREAGEELRAMASLALRHIEGRCPVCQQEHDHGKTRAALEALVESSASGDSVGVDASRIEAVAREVSNLQERRSELAAELRAAEFQLAEAEANEREIAAGLERLQLRVRADESIVDCLERARGTLANDLSQLDPVMQRGEELAVATSKAAEATQRSEVEAVLTQQTAEAEQLQSDFDRRTRTYDLAVELLEGLRGATTEVVKSELKRLSPLLQQIFAMVDPHPALRALSLIGRFTNKKGRVDAVLADPDSGKSTSAPENVLSSSQLNGVALAVFLALNLGVRRAPLELVALDDPLQSLDDVNLLGVTDLLRRLKEHRQILISTHDARFAELLERKLRPLGDDRPTFVYTFSTWARTGPQFGMSTVEAQPVRFRLVGPAA